MGKYKHYLLLLVLFLFGPQGLANALQTCSETARAPAGSQPGVIEAATGCHQTEAENNNSPDTCDAQHCCPGATFSAVYLSGHSPVDMDMERINYPGHSYIYSGPEDIFHPPKLSL